MAIKAPSPLGGPDVPAVIVPLEVLRSIRLVLVNSDSELSAQGHGRPASDKMELLSISDHCRQATKELDKYLAK